MSKMVIFLLSGLTLLMSWLGLDYDEKNGVIIEPHTVSADTVCVCFIYAVNPQNGELTEYDYQMDCSTDSEEYCESIGGEYREITLDLEPWEWYYENGAELP